MVRTLKATRYITPLREGGSLPAIIEAEDDGLYVLKFRASGQGPKALIAELLGGEIGRALGLPVPEIVFIELDPALGRNEPDYEIRSLLTNSAGLNLALDYLPGSITFDAAADRIRRNGAIDAMLASKIVWFDSYITNIDRTPRNTNMLMWHKNLWLIDHGASLYFQHQWKGAQEKSRSPFAQVKDHVLLPFASSLKEANEALRPILTQEVLESIVALIPEGWIEPDPIFENSVRQREAFVTYLTDRVQSSLIFLQEALDARTKLL